MATTLYLTNTLADVNPSSATEYALSLTRGNAAVSETGVSTDDADPILDNSFIDDASGTVVWLSKPLNAVTISGSLTVNLRALESSMAANQQSGIWIRRYTNAGDPTTDYIIDETLPSGVEMGTAEAAQNWSATPFSTAIPAGDRIGCNVFAIEIGVGVTGHTHTLFFDGPTAGASGDSFITFTETITEQAGIDPALLAGALIESIDLQVAD